MIKKFFVFIALFVLNISFVYAYDYNNYNVDMDKNKRVRYDIEDVNITDSTVSFSGWGFVDNLHTIGGQNYVVDIIALSESDLQKYANGDSSVKVVVGTHKKRTKNSITNYYVGKNALYPSLCYKTTQNGKLRCDQAPLGYYNASKADSNGYVLEGKKPSGVTKDELPGSLIDYRDYATCPTTGSGSCMHYDPYFKIQFSYNELKNTFGEKDDVIFIIKMKYAKINRFKDEKNTENNNKFYLYEAIGNDKNKCSWRDSDKSFYNCDYFNDENGSLNSGYENILVRDYSRVLAFDDRVVTNTNSDLLSKFKFSFDINFTVTENYGLIRYYGKEVVNGETKEKLLLKYQGGNYFEYRDGHNNVYPIHRIARYKAPTGGTGISTTMTYYKLCISSKTNKDDSYTYYYASKECNEGADFTSDGNVFYASSTWGSVSGRVALSIKKPPEPKGGCEVDLNYNKCEKSEFSVTCSKSVDLDIDTKVLNKGCNSTETTDRITLTSEFKIKDYSSLSSDFGIKEDYYMRGLSLGNKLNFTFNRTVSLIDKGPEIYYYVNRCYENSKGNDVSEHGYIHRDSLIDYLKDLNTDDAKKIINDIIFKENEIKNTSVSTLVDISKDSYTFKYSYPHSNDYTESNYTKNIMMLDDETNNSNFVERKYGIRYACVNNDGKIEYLESNDGCDGRKYFIPLNIPLDVNTINLNTSIKFKAINNKDFTLENNCPFNLKEWKLETFKYRVINLRDPFPNVKKNKYPSNWINAINDNNNDLTFLNKRYLAEDREYYVADLSSNNIDTIRKNNSKNLKDIYLNVGIDEERTLINNTNIFSSGGNIKKYNIGSGKYS